MTVKGKRPTEAGQGSNSDQGSHLWSDCIGKAACKLLMSLSLSDVNPWCQRWFANFCKWWARRDFSITALLTDMRWWKHRIAPLNKHLDKASLCPHTVVPLYASWLVGFRERETGSKLSSAKPVLIFGNSSCLFDWICSLFLNALETNSVHCACL